MASASGRLPPATPTGTRGDALGSSRSVASLQQGGAGSSRGLTNSPSVTTLPAIGGAAQPSRGDSARSRGSSRALKTPTMEPIELTSPTRNRVVAFDGERSARKRPLTPNSAASLIQALFRTRAARAMVQKMVGLVYERLYDEATGHYYYYNRHTGESQWTKPIHLKTDDDLPVTLYEQDKAALAAQQRTKSGRLRADTSATAATAATTLTTRSGGSADMREFKPVTNTTIVVSNAPKPRTSTGGRPAVDPMKDVTLDGFLSRIGLIEYKDALVNDGFEDLQALLGIEEIDLDSIGMKTGHKRKLIKALNKIDWDALERRNKEREAELQRSSKLKLDLSRSRRGSGGSEFQRSIASGRTDDSKQNADEQDLVVELTTLFEGDGLENPREGHLVRVHYTATLPDGKVFESSRVRGRAFQFKLGVGQVIEGWDIAIPQMTKGQRARFTVPAELAYGVEGRPPIIPPNVPLTFEVELIDFYEPEVDLTPRELEEDEWEAGATKAAPAPAPAPAPAAAAAPAAVAPAPAPGSPAGAGGGSVRGGGSVKGGSTGGSIKGGGGGGGGSVSGSRRS